MEARRAADAERKVQLRDAALATLAALPPADVEGWTDGSVLDPIRSRRGGGGFVLCDGAGEVHTDTCAAGSLCNSYRAELAALRLCLAGMLRLLCQLRLVCLVGLLCLLCLVCLVCLQCQGLLCLLCLIYLVRLRCRACPDLPEILF